MEYRKEGSGWEGKASLHCCCVKCIDSAGTWLAAFLTAAGPLYANKWAFWPWHWCEQEGLTGTLQVRLQRQAFDLQGLTTVCLPSPFHHNCQKWLYGGITHRLFRWCIVSTLMQVYVQQGTTYIHIDNSKDCIFTVVIKTVSKNLPYESLCWTTDSILYSLDQTPLSISSCSRIEAVPPDVLNEIVAALEY